jgi:hypothetical protein
MKGMKYSHFRIDFAEYVNDESKVESFLKYVIHLTKN